MSEIVRATAQKLHIALAERNILGKLCAIADDSGTWPYWRLPITFPVKEKVCQQNPGMEED